MSLRLSCGNKRTTKLLSLLVLIPPWMAQAQEGGIVEYRPAMRVSGTIRVCGSPQMGELLKLYEKGFARVQPGVHFENDLESTLTAVAGVASGKADVGLLGREIWPDEEREFVASKGHDPLVIDIATGAFDVPKATFALMVFVPAANPIASLSMEQLERIFAEGAGQVDTEKAIRTWGDLGLKGEWAQRPLHLYGFAVDNDKAQIFRQLVFRKGEAWSNALKGFSNTDRVDAGELILRAVASDPDAIGISNIHYATSELRALPISSKPSTTAIAPTRENVESRSYPLTRAVYMVVDAGPERKLGPAEREFLGYVLSRGGAADVAHEGNYLPLPAAIARQEVDSLK